MPCLEKVTSYLVRFTLYLTTLRLNSEENIGNPKHIENPRPIARPLPALHVMSHTGSYLPEATEEKFKENDISIVYSLQLLVTFSNISQNTGSYCFYYDSMTSRLIVLTWKTTQISNKMGFAT